MEEQSVVVVGAASGLGLTSVKMMIERGVERIGLIDKDEDALANVVEDSRGTDCEIEMAAGDISTANTANEIAEFVLMLASSRNTYMTGENVIVSGGYIYA